MSQDDCKYQDMARGMSTAPTATEAFKRGKTIFCGYDYGVEQAPVELRDMTADEIRHMLLEQRKWEARVSESYANGSDEGEKWGLFNGVVLTISMEVVIGGLILLAVKAV